MKRRIKTWHIMPISLLALIAVAVFVWFSRGEFATKDVALRIEGPEQIENGQREEFSVIVENNSQKALLDLNLFIELPSAFQPVDGREMTTQDFSRLDAGETKEIEFAVIASSDKSQETVKARLDYSPEEVSARFVATASKEIIVGKLDASLVFDIPSVIFAEQEIRGTLYIIPNSDIEASPIYLKLDFPPNFVLREVNQPFDYETIWRLGTLRAGDNIKREFVGRVSADATAIFRAQLGTLEGVNFLALNTTEAAVEISPSPIIITQTIESPSSAGARVGDNVELKITYTNNADVPLEDAVLKTFLPTNLVDMDSVSAQSATIDQEEGTITWDKDSNSQLKFVDVGKSGEVVLSFNVKDNLVPQNTKDTARSIGIRTRISSEKETLALGGAVLTAENSINLKIITNLDLQQDIEGEDANPPQRDELSVYTVRWVLSNTFNKANSVRVEAVLPSYGSWQGGTTPDGENVQFNSSTNTVVWTIDELDAGVGYVRSERAVEFKVGIQPSPQDISDGLKIFELTKLSAIDAFTGVFLEQNIGEIAP